MAYVERVQVFINLVQGSNSLDNVIVLLVDAELHFSSRVCVPKTQDGAVDVAGLKLLDQLAAVLAESTEEIRDDL
jgi:hypothetical protein